MRELPGTCEEACDKYWQLRRDETVVDRNRRVSSLELLFSARAEVELLEAIFVVEVWDYG